MIDGWVCHTLLPVDPFPIMVMRNGCARLSSRKIRFDREQIFIRDHTTSSRRHRDVVSTMTQGCFTESWWAVHASNSKYTTRDSCSLQRSSVNFLLFLALWHASRITTRKREVTKLCAFRQTEESLPTQSDFSNEFYDNMFIIITS